MTDDTIERIEATLDKPEDELEEELPVLLEETEGQIRGLIQEHPTTFGRIVDRMEEMDIASFVSDNPDTADRFQELLWTGTEVIVENNEEIREGITQDITVNFEANDCPMTGHLEVDGDERMVTGGAGHLEDATLEITATADVLVGLMTGRVNPVQGFMSGEYDLDGPVAQGTTLAPLITDLSESIPG